MWCMLYVRVALGHADPMEVANMIVAKYALEIVMDAGAWQRNYGDFDNPADLASDIRDSMASIVAELVDDWIDKTGNEGAVRKVVIK